MLDASQFHSGLNAKFDKIKLALSDGSFDQPIERAAWRCHRELVLLTPKGWTGLTRRAWQVSKPGPGERLIFNKSKVFLFLTKGTGNAGTPTSHGGYIYPASKRFLFIPLNARAALQGWQPGMVYGRDYRLAKRVRGIKAMEIVKNFQPKSRVILREEVKAFLQKALT